MGNPASKIVEEFKEQSFTPGTTPSTPILTPKLRNVDDFDPRSPSANILRTPIQIQVTPIKTPPPALEDLSDMKCDTFNINSPAPIGICSDPRSPSIEFSRTPIVVSGADGVPKKIYNKNFDNVRKTLLAITPRKICDIPSHVPPKLLTSSPLYLKPDANKRKSYVGVLETNLDFIETNLDDVIQNKTPLREYNSSLSPELKELRAKFVHNLVYKIPIDVLETENIDPRSPTGDFMRTPLNVLKKVGEIDLNITEGIADTADMTIEDDGLIINSKDVVNSTEVEVTNETQIEEQYVAKPVTITPKMNEIRSKTISSIKDFDKKLSTLIYTDEDADVLPKSVAKIKDGANRTPLGTRNGEPKKSAAKLKVSDKPRRGEYACSKIPVFKEKKQRGLAIQCENTPPRNINLNKIKRAQWDGDNTLII